VAPRPEGGERYAKAEGCSWAQPGRAEVLTEEQIAQIGKSINSGAYCTFKFLWIEAKSKTFWLISLASHDYL
jgi:hypothetical protein